MDDPVDRPFDPWRVPVGAPASEAVAAALDLITGFEGQHNMRRRKRRPDDAAVMAATVSALVADAMHRTLQAPEGWIAVPFDKKRLGVTSRYKPPALNQQVPRLVRIMADPGVGLLELRVGFPARRKAPGEPWTQGRQTTIRAGPALRRWMSEAGIGFRDLGRAVGEEVIILRGHKCLRRGGKLKADDLEYEDTEVTRRWRAEVEEINDRLKEADLDVVGLPPDAPPIDTSNRSLRRIFNEADFACGGRLFGGFWQSLPPAVRVECLRIDGEQAAEVDLTGSFTTLAYLSQGRPPPAGDPYAVPGLEHHREGAKKLHAALLFDGKRRTRKPQNTAHLLPQTSAAELVAAIHAAHEPIKHIYGTRAGFELMRFESDILVQALLSLFRSGIPVLPLHDAIICRASQAGLVIAAWEAASTDILGLPVPVKVKGG